MDFIFLGSNARMQEFVRSFNQVARTDIPVLIVGEPGTGKELVAQALHQRSLHSEEPFVRMDCQLCPPAKLEALLENLRNIRWTQGVQPFDGTQPAADGKQTAGTGTLFLREIANLGNELQGKVLPFLPNGDGELTWGSTDGKLPPRLLASTSRDIRQEVAENRFRQDLYVRLGGVWLEIPALRNRKEDLPALAEEFLRKFSHDFGRPDWPRLSPAAIEAMHKYDWPGNLLELSSVMKRIAFLGSEDGEMAKLREVSCGDAQREDRPNKASPKSGMKVLAREAAQRVEREMILQVLLERRWNRKRAAVALNISYKTLLSKIKQLGLAYDA